MILALQLAHFSAALVCALCASTVFGVCFRNDQRAMLRYGAYCFAMFIGLMIVAGWAMRFLHR